MPDVRVASATLPDTGAQRARRGFAMLALSAAALTLVVIVASAFMRHAQAGLSCADWPSCYARVGGIADASGIALARGIHRLAATGTSLAVLAMAALAFVRRVPGGGQRGWTLAALAIIAGLAVLGLATPGARLPAVALTNLLGGMALLAVLAAAHASTRVPDAAAPGWRTLAIATLALVIVQATLGGLISTQSAVLACPDFPGCADASWRDFAAGGAWNPFRAPAERGGGLVAPPGAAALHLIHRLDSLLVCVLVLVLAARLWRPHGRLASALALTLATGFGAGIAAALVPSSFGVTLIHNATAAMLAALLAYAAALPGPPAWLAQIKAGVRPPG